MQQFSALTRLALACGAMLALVGPALACTCPPVESAAAQAEQADLVAIVTAGEREEFGQTPWGVPEYFETQFQVHEVLKGPDMDALTVRTSAPGNPMCGILWEEGADMVLLAREREEGGYSAWMCSLARFPEEAFRAALGD